MSVDAVIDVDRGVISRFRDGLRGLPDAMKRGQPPTVAILWARATSRSPRLGGWFEDVPT